MADKEKNITRRIFVFIIIIILGFYIYGEYINDYKRDKNLIKYYYNKTIEKLSIFDKENKFFYLQVGAFEDENEANKLRANLILLGLEVEIEKPLISGLGMNKVLIGPIESTKNLSLISKKLKKNNIKYIIISDYE
tara:strand:+ start:190 stop:597 length:408 start_codon:yes stop_codon:yes gene_type:complete